MDEPSDVIVIAEYPQLWLLAWSLRRNPTMTGAEAFALYEANWRFIADDELMDRERALIDRLIATYGQGFLNA